MANFKWFGCLVLAASVVTTLGAETRCPGNVASVPFRVVNRQIIVVVSVNRSGPYDFLLDTGSQVTIIDPSLARELHLTPVGHVGVVSDVRRAVVDMVRLGRIETGSNSDKEEVAAVQSLAQMRAANLTVRGVLGENFLAQFALLIDYRHSLLCLDATGRMQQALQGERIPMVIKAGWNSSVPQPLLIPVQLGEPSRKMVLRLDSGANVPQLYVNTLDTAPWVQKQKALRGSVTGDAAEYFALMPAQDIRIGKQVVRNTVFATPLKAARNVDFSGEDGLLPTALFKRVFISYASNSVILNPR